jgi:cytochrome c biogenesis protein CcdA
MNYIIILILLGISLALIAIGFFSKNYTILYISGVIFIVMAVFVAATSIEIPAGYNTTNIVNITKTAISLNQTREYGSINDIVVTKFSPMSNTNNGYLGMLFAGLGSAIILLSYVSNRQFKRDLKQGRDDE